MKMTRLVAVLGLLACSKAGESLVPVDVTSSVAEVAAVSVVVARAGKTVVEKKADWSLARGGILRLGVYVDRSVSGQIAVRANGLSPSGAVLATAAEKTVDVAPGQVAGTVALALLPARDAPDAGAPDAIAPAGGDAAPPIVMDAGAELPPPLDHPTWRPPERLQDNPLGDGADNVRVAVHKTKGDAVAVFNWNGRLKAVRYDAAMKTWSGAVMIAEHPHVSGLELGMDGGSRAFVGWDSGTNDDPALDGVWESHSDDGGKTWTPKARLGPGPVAYGIVLAVARNGRARLAWHQDTVSLPVQTTVFSAYYDGTHWTPAAAAMAAAETARSDPSLGIDDTGAGVLAWQSRVAGLWHYLVSTFTGPALDPPRELFDSSSSYVKNNPLVAVGPDGKAVALWQLEKTAGGPTATVARWYTPGAGWAAAPEPLPDLSFFFWRAVLDRTGAATVVFDTPLSASFNAAALRYEPGNGWQPPTLLEMDDTATYMNTTGEEDQYLFPIASADAAGDVQVVWRKRKVAAGPHSLVGRTYVPGMGWQPEVTIAEHKPLAVGHPTTLDSADDGRALAGFFYQDPLKMTTGVDTYQLTVAWFR